MHKTVQKKAQAHRTSIMHEIRRIENAKLEKQKAEDKKKADTLLRKERRNALREAVALRTLTNNFLAKTVSTSLKVEYTPTLAIYDIREYHPTKENGVFVIGGFIGELLLVFTALYDFVLSNPINAEFKFTTEAVEKFLSDWMKEADFPEGTCVLKLKDELDLTITDDKGNVDIGMSANQIGKALCSAIQHQSFGMKMLLNNRKDVLLNDNALYEVFAAIARVSLIQPKKEKPLPDESAENYQ